MIVHVFMSMEVKRAITMKMKRFVDKETVNISTNFNFFFNINVVTKFFYKDPKKRLTLYQKNHPRKKPIFENVYLYKNEF